MRTQINKGDLVQWRKGCHMGLDHVCQGSSNIGVVLMSGPETGFVTIQWFKCQTRERCIFMIEDNPYHERMHACFCHKRHVKLARTKNSK